MDKVDGKHLFVQRPKKRRFAHRATREAEGKKISAGTAP